MSLVASTRVAELEERSILVAYTSVDDPDGTLSDGFHEAIAADAKARAVEGCHLASMSVYPLRNGSTLGSAFSDGGGNFATVLGATAVYERSTT